MSSTSLGTRRDMIKNGHAFPVPLGDNLTGSPKSSSLPKHPTLVGCGEIANPQAMSTRTVRSGQPDAEAIYGPGGYKHVIWRMEAQELNVRRRISEGVARSKLGCLEREARHALFNQKHQLRVAVEKHQGQAREVSSHAERALNENSKPMMIQELQNLQDRHVGQMEINERTVAQLIASEAQEALRRQRYHLYRNTNPAGERTRDMEGPVALENAAESCRVQKSYARTGVARRTESQTYKKRLRHN